MRGAAATIALLLALCCSATFAQTNTMTITDKTGAGLTNYPVQFGRPFKTGEITDFPQVVLAGSAVPTQADVKQRWGDGSVKHAIISFILPSLSAGASVTVTFQNQMVADGGSPVLTQAEMLNTRFNFDAVTEIVNTSTVSASARAMLTAGKYTIWTSGGIATTIVLGDHSAARAYDLGFDSFKSFRPTFVATFWNSLNKVRVRFVGEVSNSEVLQDMAYRLNLRLGSSSPQAVYSSGGFLPHILASRWTKIFWINGAPAQQVDIDHNTPYIISTRFLPNYNMTLASIPVSVRNSQWNDWNSTAKDLYDPGYWTKYMPSTGGRDDIGLITRQVAAWLFSAGDWRMREIALVNADLAAAWGMHVRESNTTRFFDKERRIPGMGKFVSIYGRPTVWLLDNRGPQEEAVVPLTTALNYDIYNYENWISSVKQGWVRDSAHQPDPYYVPYMLTGDYFYLEQLQFWAAMGVLEWCVGAPYCRGPNDQTKPLAGIQGQIRGNAWIFRTRVHASWISPDGTPERSYFDNVTAEAIAYWEGFKGITGTQFDGTFPKTWALETIFNSYNGRVSQLYVFENDESLADGPVNSAVCGAAVSMWMEYMLINALGWAKERGYPTGPLLTYMGKGLIRQVTDGTWDPKCIALYRSCIRRRSDNYFYTTWAESIESYTSPFTCSLSDCGDMNHGYGTMATAAATWLLGEQDGGTTWTYLRDNCRSIPSTSTITSNPKWMLIPRPDSIAPGAFNPAPPRVPSAASPARTNTGAPGSNNNGAPGSNNGGAPTSGRNSSASASLVSLLLSVATFVVSIMTM